MSDAWAIQRRPLAQNFFILHNLSVDIATWSPPVLELLLLAGCQLVRPAGLGLGRRPTGKLESTFGGGCTADAVLRVRLLTTPAAGFRSLAVLSGPDAVGC